jgi:hypothetical protein
VNGTSGIPSAPEVMNLRKVAMDWSKENFASWADLEDLLLDAVFEGEFEDLFAHDKGSAIYFIDPETSEREAYAGPDLAQRLIDAAADAELTFYYFARAAKEAELYAIHREAVLLFAERRGLAPPSWWHRE